MKREITLQSKEGTKPLRIPQNANNINTITSLVIYFITLWWIKETFQLHGEKAGPWSKAETENLKFSRAATKSPTE